MKTFLNTLYGRGLCFGLAVVVLAVSGANTVRAYQIPREIALPSIGYTQTGTFDYAVTLKPSTLYGTLPVPDGQQTTVEQDSTETQDEARHLFFRSIVSDFWMSYTYDLDAGEALSTTDVEAEVVIYAEEPGVWQKDIERFFATQRALPLVVDFELDYSAIESKVRSIAEDIGGSTTNVRYRVESVVKLTAVTIQGVVITDTYVHSVAVKLDTRAIELVAPLEATQPVGGAGVGWSHRGRFDYEVFLNYNDLYDEPVLRSMGLPTARPEEPAVAPQQAARQVLGPGYTYFPNLVEKVDADFSYVLECDSIVNDLSHQVGVTVTIANKDVWEKSLALVPSRTEDGDFTMSFPIDIVHYTRVIDAIGDETGMRGSSHTLAFTATVRTTGFTNLGQINESFTHTMQGTLDKGSLSFDASTLQQSAQGKVGGGTRPNAAAPPGGWRTPWLIGVVLGLAALALLYWREQKLRGAQRLSASAAAAQIRKKYRDLVVDVIALPVVDQNQVVVQLESVADLAKIADDAVKPMLHYAADSSHEYVVLDGAVRYQYLISAGLSSE